LPSAITFESISQTFGGYTAVNGIDLEIAAGKFVSVVGPSGCGKSTLLNLAAGLIAPTRGRVSIFGSPLTGLNRRATYMFQHDALLPWKTVLENVGLGLAAFAGKFPSQLSGGMRKRVAMAQCWIVDPDILLMDEPFSALDIHTRMRMEGELLDLWTGSPKTVLFVTHDLEEALSLSDEVMVLSAGPASRVVARHIIDLPRPRDLMDIRTEPRFAELYREIWAQLKEEVLTSYAR
jgi:NitT/TauT family transport system ATP-binding protein